MAREALPALAGAMFEPGTAGLGGGGEAWKLDTAVSSGWTCSDGLTKAEVRWDLGSLHLGDALCNIDA